jgi:hypothetical protein
MAKQEKIRRLSRVKPADADSVERVKRRTNERGRAMDILMEAQQHWMNMDRFRRQRKRNKDYCFGKQWDDVIVVDGRRITEEQYIKEQGQVPLKNNLIRRLVRNVTVTYRIQQIEPVCGARDRKE